ncbi:MAG: Ig-like domain-containing protein, partial [Candidatus Thermoplasmatota archaeon]|nr:Ig-like domain-containing protein [Candidatus Thermoplasmatota archaeon]
SPESSWANASKQEAIIFYDFEGVKWHDGIQMDVRDIMFSYHAAAQHPFWRGDVECLMGDNYSAQHWLHVEKVWESGTQAALKFTLQIPYWHFFNRALAVKLLPEHVWAYTVSGQNVDGAKIWCDADYVVGASSAWNLVKAQAYEILVPVGSGIFAWEGSVTGQDIIINTWRGHFFKTGFKYGDYCLSEYGEPYARQPNIDGISFLLYTTTEAAIDALKNNKIDYISWSVLPINVQELSNEPGISLSQSMDQGFYHVGYNLDRVSFGYDGAGNDFGKPLRKAIAHCIDKNQLVTRMLYGLGISGAGPVSSISHWYNRTIPRYPFDLDEAKQILAGAGYKVNRTGTLLTGDAAKAAAGNGTWWVNPDGSEIGSSDGGSIEIIAPEASYDPIRATGGLMISKQLRDIGINATYVPMGFGAIVDRMNQGNFDMYILGYRTGYDPSGYLHTYFHSNNSPDAQNYGGYSNQSFDATIELARSTDDSELRKKAIFEAQAAICYDLPIDVLYYRTNIEAYRSNRFIGWSVGISGSIFNLESLVNIRSPSPRPIARFVNIPSAVPSNSTGTQITVLVTDQHGNPLPGAEVWLNASLGKLYAEYGITSSTGKFTTTFTAPYADPFDPEMYVNGTPVIIQLKEVRYTDSGGIIYDPAPSQLALIRVYPGDVPFISVSTSADPDIIDPDISTDGTPGFAYAYVRVTDQNGDPVAGASVALKISPEVPDVEPGDQLTDADGKATFKVMSVDLPDDDGSVKEYILTAIATKPSYTNTQAINSVNIYIVDAMPQPLPPPETYTGETVLALFAVFAAAITISMIIRRRRKT